MQKNTDKIYIKTFPIDRFHKSEWRSIVVCNSNKKNYGFVKIIEINNKYKFLKMKHFNANFFHDMKVIIKNESYQIIEREELKNLSGDTIITLLKIQ